MAFENLQYHLFNDLDERMQFLSLCGLEKKSTINSNLCNEFLFLKIKVFFFCCCINITSWKKVYMTFISMVSKRKTLFAAILVSYLGLRRPTSFTGCVGLVADCSTAEFIWFPGVNIHKHSKINPTGKDMAEGWVMHLINNASNQQYWAFFSFCMTPFFWHMEKVKYFLYSCELCDD